MPNVPKNTNDAGGSWHGTELADKVGLWPNDPREDIELDVRLRN